MTTLKTRSAGPMAVPDARAQYCPCPRSARAPHEVMRENLFEHTQCLLHVRQHLFLRHMLPSLNGYPNRCDSRHGPRNGRVALKAGGPTPGGRLLTPWLHE